LLCIPIPSPRLKLYLGACEECWHTLAYLSTQRSGPSVLAQVPILWPVRYDGQLFRNSIFLLHVDDIQLEELGIA
jgi:hypothetical protein